MNQRILKVIMALLLIITLTMADFLLLCVNAVSYAVDTLSLEKKTNHKNIEFMAYFKDSDGNKITDLDAETNNNNLKLYFNISVKQEGYFNGNIVLKESNFKLKTDIMNNTINRIEGNTIYLNQINAGENKEIEVGIDLLKEDEFDLNLLNMKSIISINGTYRDSTQKDISIYSDRNVSLTFISPYSDEQESIILSQEVITNKILRYNGEDKRVIQVQVKSGLNNNLFPIKNTLINAKAIEISGEYAEKILVNSNSTLVTNGKKISEDNWNYNKENGVISINIQNEPNNNKISWNKEGQDTIIITYIFDKDIEINNEELQLDSNIELYDENNTTIKASNKIALDKNEKDATITTKIVESEANIYKGKLYAGISRDITHTTILDINLNNVADEINVIEENSQIGEIGIDSIYKYTRINKNNLQSILGNSGTLSILNATTNEVIAVISKDTEADENGNIIITYPEGINQIKIKTTAPENIGNIEIQSTKTINQISRDVVREASNIISRVDGDYLSNSNINKINVVESSVELKETKTSADIELNKTDISTMSSNNVEMRVTLKSRDEEYELYKNPILRVQLPSKIENVEIVSINLVYEDQLKIQTAKLIDGNIIEIQLLGEQTKYKEEAIDGAMIIINANLTTSKKLTSSSEQIVLTYMNENVVNYENGTEIGQVSKQINLVSYAGVVTINKVAEYGAEIINNDSEGKIVNIDIDSTDKKVKVENEIINNEPNKISNVKVMGTLPSKDAVQNVNNMDVSIDGQVALEGISLDKAKVYYSENASATAELSNEENGWTETIKDSKNVKKYLAIINELDVNEGVNISYNADIPEELGYNLNAEQGYSVYYTSEASEEKVDVNPITLSTPKGAMIETELKALVGGKESNEAKEDEVIRYAINISNTGSEVISNIKALAKVPEGTIFVNTDALNNEIELENLVFEDEDKKEVEFEIETLAPGQKIVKYYEVKVKRGIAGSDINNSVNIQYGDVTKTSNEVKTNIKEGKLELKLISVDAQDGLLKSGYQYRYVLYITNTSDKDVKNIETTIDTGDMLNISEMYYIDSNNNAIIKENTNNIKIDQLSAGETIELSISSNVEIFKDNINREVSLKANCILDEETYSSNEINLTVESNLNIDMVVTSENSGEYVKAGDTIKYDIAIKNNGNEAANSITFNNWISNDVTLSKVEKNEEELSDQEYSLEMDNNKNQKSLTIKEDSIDAGQSVNYEVEVVANLLYGDTGAVEIINDSLLKVDSFEVATAKVEHILQPFEMTLDEEDDGNSQNDNQNGNQGNNNSPSSNETQQYKIISGIAWIDENEDGQRGTNEKTMEGIKVKLLDITTNEFAKDESGNILTSETNSTGFYNFTKVKKGQYLVIFEYNTTQYGLTTFEKEGISDELNSNVITKKIDINGTEQLVAATEIISINNANISNVNIGLIQAKKYDFQLDKYISKVTVQNNKTITKNYTNQTLVKQEIDAKQVNSTTIVVEYTIRVTNNGDVAGYVKKIADYLSVDYKFNSELNKNWYQSGNEVYCTSLANEKIEPGESKEVTLTVIKEMKENNTGLINNTAEIVSSYNELGLTDINSTEGNKAAQENDMGSADLIISIKTGQVIVTFSLIFLTIGIIVIAIIYIKRFI